MVVRFCGKINFILNLFKMVFDVRILNVITLFILLYVKLTYVLVILEPIVLYIYHPHAHLFHGIMPKTTSHGVICTDWY